MDDLEKIVEREDVPGDVREEIKRCLAEKNNIISQFKNLNNIFLNLIENLPVGVTGYDKDMNYTIWNKFMEEITGVKGEEVIGRKCYEIFPHIAETGLLDLIKEALNGKIVHSKEYRYYSKRIDYGIAKATYFPNINEENEIIGAIGIIEDVTDRKIIEEKRKMSTANFKHLFDKSPLAIVLLDPEDRVINANPEFTRLFEYKSDEIIGLPINDIIVPEEEKENASKISKRVLSGETIKLEAIRKKKDGTLVDVLILGTPIVLENRNIGVYGIYQDITERKVAERKIIEREALLNAVFEAAPDAIFVERLNGDIITVNKRGEEIYGYTIEELKGLNVKDIVPDQVAKNLDKIIQEHINNGGIHIESYGLRKNGEIFNTEVSTKVVRVDTEPIVIAYVKDITEKVKVTEKLKKTAVALEEAYVQTLEAWSRFLDRRSEETGEHTKRVTELTVEMGKLLGFDDEKIKYMKWGSLLHDIGKIVIPDYILLSPTKLSPDEMEVMKRHPIFAKEILYEVEYLRPALLIPYYHHENWDGSGYPEGLKGEDIPIEARIFTIIDNFDARTNQRVYRPALSHSKVLEEMKKEAGKKFDPKILEVFINYLTSPEGSKWLK